MYGSPAMSKDLNLPFLASPFKQGKDEGDLHHQHQQQQQQMSSSLLRYRSAPSTVLGDVCEEFLPHRSPSPEASESMFARFMTPDLRDHMGGKQGAATAASEVAPRQSGGFPSSAAQILFHSPLQPPPPPPQIPNLSSAASSAMETGVNSNLIRHSSSPAGLFSHLGVENGFAGIRSMGGFRQGGGGGSNGEGGATSCRLKGQISFSSRQGSTGFMSQISEIGSEGIGGSSPEESGMGNGVGGGSGGRCYIPGYPVTSWDDSALLSDGFSGLKRIMDPSEAQNGEMRNHVQGLTHHFSLPKASTEMAAMERFLQFQDAVPCKIRAKRGCATHPRSIAERVRRTRISERMRKLQELVPNMDKQTNTADMLDLAVDYIKELQRQAQTLADNRANCTCSSKHKP